MDTIIKENIELRMGFYKIIVWMMVSVPGKINQIGVDERKAIGIVTRIVV